MATEKKPTKTTRKPRTTKTTTSRKPTTSKTNTRKPTSGRTKRTTTRKRTSRTTKRGGTSAKSTGKTVRERLKDLFPSSEFSVNWTQKIILLGFFLIFFTAIIAFSLLSPSQGRLTSLMSNLMWFGFGWGIFFILPSIMGIGFYLILIGMEQSIPIPKKQLISTVVLFLVFEAFATMISMTMQNLDVWAVTDIASGGGYLGGFLVWSIEELIGFLGALLLYLSIGVVAIFTLTNTTLNDLIHLLQSFKEKTAVALPKSSPPTAKERTVPQRTNPLRQQPTSPSTTTHVPTVNNHLNPIKETTAINSSSSRASTPTSPEPVLIGAASPTQGKWDLPRIEDILEKGTDTELSNLHIREQVEIIEHTLESFGAPVTVVEINQGPTITQFGVEPNYIESRNNRKIKVKVGKIASLVDDLALALAAKSIRIQAPVPGKGYVGIEVPNSSKSIVSLRDVMESELFNKIKSPLRIGLGQNVSGQPIVADLAAMPHMLVAGATGSGKSVCVNAIIASLLLLNSPNELKMVMVDPKRVELTGYNGIPHLVAPVVVDMDRVIGTLQWATREMDRRYKQLAEIGARNIVDYNKKASKQGAELLPYIVIIIDELADLMMLSPEDTERGITRLAQMARATGMHMIIATQRPSVDVVTGLIKANFPARIAFAVASSTDSRVILDTTGAERLLGQGDMLFQSPDAASPIRMQGCYVSDGELSDLISYWQKARRFQIVAPENSENVAPAKQKPLWEDLIAKEQKEIQSEPSEDQDELLAEAIALVRKLDKASTSMLQRHFRIGYTRASRIIDVMEEQGIVGPASGTTKGRDLLPIIDKN